MDGKQIFKFRSPISGKVLGNIFDFTIFVVKVYVKYWTASPMAIQAPLNDLRFLRELHRYKRINERIANEAVKTFCRHLWYLSEQLVGFSFFDERISDEKLTEMVAALGKEPVIINQYRNQTISGEAEDIDIASLISKETLRFFHILADNREPNFLNEHPSQWKNDTVYNDILQVVKNLTVVNDPAERAVALITNFNNSITTDEEQKQYLLQNVEFCRQNMPNRNKRTIVDALTKNKKICQQR